MIILALKITVTEVYEAIKAAVEKLKETDVGELLQNIILVSQVITEAFAYEIWAAFVFKDVQSKEQKHPPYEGFIEVDFSKPVLPMQSFFKKYIPYKFNPILKFRFNTATHNELLSMLAAPDGKIDVNDLIFIGMILGLRESGYFIETSEEVKV